MLRMVSKFYYVSTSQAIIPQLIRTEFSFILKIIIQNIYRQSTITDQTMLFQ